MNPKIPPLFKDTVTSAPAKATPPTATAKPEGPAQNAAASAGTTAGNTAKGAPASALTVEGTFQRLRYFENLAEQHEAYIEVLKAAMRRLGGAVPSAYFAPLTGAGGSHQPKSG